MEGGGDQNHLQENTIFQTKCYNICLMIYNAIKVVQSAVQNNAIMFLFYFQATSKKPLD